MEKFFSGEKLYGDDFSIEEIKKWYSEEEEAYAGLVKDHELEHSYEYHQLNIIHGYKHLPSQKKIKNVLGLGSSFGYEFIPILERIENLTILEPSGYLKSQILGSLQPKYVKPAIDGMLEFPNDSFDLITCFGTLHHIPNVKYVISEMVRVLSPGGYMLIREPIRTMGDWREARPGLTKNERGIPYQYFDEIFKNSNVKVVKKSFCESLFAYKLIKKIIDVNINSIKYQKFDGIISKFLSFNIYYHPLSKIQKIGPGSVFYVIQKQ
jgi:SAM-dependent methyltransferase